MDAVLLREYSRVLSISARTSTDCVVVLESGEAYVIRFSSSLVHGTSTPIESIKKAKSSALCSDFLLLGCRQVISGFRWPLFGQKALFHIKLDVRPNRRGFVSCMASDEMEGRLFAATDDNIIHVVDPENARPIGKLIGHSGFIHGLSATGGAIASCSEDGSVKLWDIRMNRCTATIEPFRNKELARPNLGKWLGAVALDKGWLICGGGPRLSIYQQRYAAVAQSFSCGNSTIQSIQIAESDVFAGGSDGNVYRYRFSSEPVATISTSVRHVYAMEFVDRPQKALMIGGSSSKMDVCTSLMYKDSAIDIF